MFCRVGLTLPFPSGGGGGEWGLCFWLDSNLEMGGKLLMNWMIARYTRGSGWAMRGAIDHGLCAPERANKFSNFCMRGSSSGH